MKAALIGPELEENLALRYIHASIVQGGQEAACRRKKAYGSSVLRLIASSWRTSATR